MNIYACPCCPATFAFHDLLGPSLPIHGVGERECRGSLRPPVAVDDATRRETLAGLGVERKEDE